MSTAMDRLSSLKVSDVMTRHVVQVSVGQSMADAAREFLGHDISAAPVVDERGHCVGFLSAADFIARHVCGANAIDSRATGDGTTGDGATGDASRAQRPGDTVRHYMTRGVQSVEPHAPLLHAAQLMCQAHVHRLPVIHGGRLVGVVSTMDLVAALMNSIEEMQSRQFQPIDF
jgi:CBS domain-containing protein